MNDDKPNYNVNGYFMYGDSFCMPPDQGLGNREPQDMPWHGHNYGEPCTDYRYWKGRPQTMPYGFRPPVNGCNHCHPGYGPNPPRKPKPNGNDYYNNPPIIPATKKCNCALPDRFPVSNVINVETRLVLSLDITLYNVEPKEDKTIRMETDKKYSIIYVTEEGVKKVIGYLKYIDTSIPTDCLRYIGNNNEVTDFAYIIVDASSEGKSDIQKIFIRTIRDIEEITNNTEEDEEEKPPYIPPHYPHKPPCPCHPHHHPRPPKYDGPDVNEPDEDVWESDYDNTDTEITDDDYL